MADLNSKSVRELRSILHARGVDYSDCIEKSDLIQRVLDTANKEPAAGSVTNVSRTIGSLNCRIVLNNSQPDFIVILSHGFGADNNDLAPIGTSILGIPAIQTKKVWFVFPNAPLSLGQGGRGWWNINIQELFQRAMSGQLDHIMNETPVGMEGARESLLGVIRQLKSEHPSVPWSRFIIGGFSQGAILSMDVGLHLQRDDDESTPLQIVCWSGALMCRQEWEKIVQGKKKNLKVFATHGTQDPLLPFVLGDRLHQFLRGSGIFVEFTKFEGGHNVPPLAISKLTQILTEN